MARYHADHESFRIVKIIERQFMFNINEECTLDNGLRDHSDFGHRTFTPSTPRWRVIKRIFDLMLASWR